MFSYYSKFWLTSILTLISLMGVLVSPSWLVSWFFLEVNLLAILPLLQKGSLYYFIIQSLSGLLMLWGLIIEQWVIVYVSLLAKLGLFPFCFWVPSVIQDSPWVGGSFLCSWTKLVPTILFCHAHSFVYFISLFTIIWGGVYGCFQSITKKILACSSVSHTGWFMILFSMQIENSFIYLLIYFPLVFLLFMQCEGNFLNTWSSIDKNQWSILFILLVLSGLPPFSGFWLKVLVYESFNEGFNLLIVFFFLSTVFNVFFYFKLMLGFLNCSKVKSWKDGFLILLLFIPQFFM